MKRHKGKRRLNVVFGKRNKKDIFKETTKLKYGTQVVVSRVKEKP